MKKRFLTVVFCVVIFVMNIGTISSFLVKNTLDLSELSIKKLESEYDSFVFSENEWIEIYSIYCRLSDKRIIEDEDKRYTVYKMDNGQLTWNYEYRSTENMSQNYISFAKAVEEIGKRIIYVQAPFKVDKYNNQLPYGIEDTTNLMADELVSDIRLNKCEILDLREVIHEEGLQQQELFFNTDHHWTPEAGVWATEKIINYINNKVECMDGTHLQLDDYNRERMKDVLYGSQGKRVGRLYAGLDDMTLITPKYDTDYQYTIPVVGYDRRGTYKETLLFYDYLENGSAADDANRVYTGDNYSYSMMKNYNAANDTSVLLIRDSFSRVIAPFMISACDEMHIIDMRTYSENVLELIQEKEVDIVIVLYNPSVVVNEKFFGFK